MASGAAERVPKPAACSGTDPVDADALYGLPLGEFVAARTALAKELRAGSDREQAGVVAKLPKPSVAAGAVNLLVRGEPDAVAFLFEAGDELAAAQERLLAGEGDALAMRAATEREREAVDALVDLAGDLGAATLEKVHATFHAAALDENAREAVRGGRLIRELSHAGLGFGISEVTAAVPAPRSAQEAKGAPPAKAARGAKPGRTKQATDPDPAEAERRAAEEAERRADEERQAEAERRADEERQAEAERRADEERQAEAERRADEERLAEAERRADEVRRQADAAVQRAARAAERAAEARTRAQQHRDVAAAALAEAETTLADAQEAASAAAEALEQAQAAVPH